MDNLDISEESNDEIHIYVEEDNKEVEPTKEDTIESEESARLSLEYSLEVELANLPKEYNLFGKLIYKVSEKYRKVKEESYTPRVVSIGPLHHGKSHLQAMETFKLKCLKNLKDEFGACSLKDLYKYATDMERVVRGFYQDFKFNAKEFSKMILLDGIFIILLIVKDNERIQKVGHTLLSGQNSWMASDIKHDMLLLENQLPLFFVGGLLERLDPQQYDSSLDSFFKDLRAYFNEVGKTSTRENEECKFAWHLVDFLLKLHLPYTKEVTPSNANISNYTISASELRQAGVRFCPVPSEGLFKVSFDKESGKLELPQLTLNDTTETFFRNLIAFEQSQHQKYIASYIIFMDSLINTAEDVELLVKHEIIENLLGENHLVADMFNNLHKEVIEDGRDFYFTQICNDLNKYSKNCFHQWRSSCFKWRSILKNKYFSNPWSAISFIAATIVVVLTIVQTVCSVLGLNSGVQFF